MQKTPLYTVGHGTRKAEDFLAVLNRYDIKYLVDVRLVPYSRFNPHYRQAALKSFLEANGITYVFMGKRQSGLFHCQFKTIFKEGISRLNNAWEKNISLAIMCSESKPAECHRTHLIANALTAEGVGVVHINETGNLIAHNLPDTIEENPTLF